MLALAWTAITAIVAVWIVLIVFRFFFPSKGQK